MEVTASWPLAQRPASGCRTKREPPLRFLELRGPAVSQYPRPFECLLGFWRGLHLDEAVAEATLDAKIAVRDAVVER
jgi:hypothetical protein